jgi:hypothetical protein
MRSDDLDGSLLLLRSGCDGDDCLQSGAARHMNACPGQQSWRLRRHRSEACPGTTRGAGGPGWRSPSRDDTTLAHRSRAPPSSGCGRTRPVRGAHRPLRDGHLQQTRLRRPHSSRASMTSSPTHVPVASSWTRAVVLLAPTRNKSVFLWRAASTITPSSCAGGRRRPSRHGSGRSRGPQAELARHLPPLTAGTEPPDHPRTALASLPGSGRTRRSAANGSLNLLCLSVSCLPHANS